LYFCHSVGLVWLTYCALTKMIRICCCCCCCCFFFLFVFFMFSAASPGCHNTQFGSCCCTILSDVCSLYWDALIPGPFLSTCGEEGEDQMGVEATLPSCSSKNASPIPSPCPIIMAVGPERLSSGKERGDVIRYVVKRFLVTLLKLKYTWAFRYHVSICMSSPMPQKYSCNLPFVCIPIYIYLFISFLFILLQLHCFCSDEWKVSSLILFPHSPCFSVSC
jgi:hypothetical protein